MNVGGCQTPVTELLALSRGGDAQARDAAYAAVYEELKRAARKQLRGSSRKAFQTTTLVHEAWLKLSATDELAPMDRHHLMALSTQAMRYVLVDHARRACAQKRGNGLAELTLTESNGAMSQPAIEVLALHDLLEKLQAFDSRAAKIVELRYFGGYEESEIAPMLDVSQTTVNRDWRRARAWLAARLNS